MNKNTLRICIRNVNGAKKTNKSQVSLYSSPFLKLLWCYIKMRSWYQKVQPVALDLTSSSNKLVKMHG